MKKITERKELVKDRSYLILYLLGNKSRWDVAEWKDFDKNYFETHDSQEGHCIDFGATFAVYELD